MRRIADRPGMGSELARASALAATLSVGLLGCGRGPGTQATRDTRARAATVSPQDRALGLTIREPVRFRDACRRLRAVVGGEGCPALVPQGALHVQIAGPSRGWPRTFAMDLMSPSLGSLHGRPIDAAGGHWTIEATGSTTGRRLFALQIRPNSLDRPTRCARAHAGGAPVVVCRVPTHEHGGGYYAGHVTAEWRSRGRAIQLTAHGYANRARVLAMLASVRGVG